jgi:hypothetical protein
MVAVRVDAGAYATNTNSDEPGGLDSIRIGETNKEMVTKNEENKKAKNQKTKEIVLKQF